ncbi:MAG: DUF3488 and DUF4129 domain-containing transglutaminase family protein [Acidimicrobiales bacterium]
MRAIDAIRRANQPGAPEDSIRLRAACTGTVVVAIAASSAVGEVSHTTALTAVSLVCLGMVFSYVTRSRPPWWVKVVIAAAAVAAFVWFFHSVSALASGLATVEDPLTLLLVCVLVVHSFHVPARRDLMFSLVAAAGLMAIGGAQAIDLSFGFSVVAWACFGLWGLIEMWTSASGGGRVSVAGLGLALVATITAAAAVFLVLPAPTVSARVNFLTASGIGGSVAVPGALAGDAASPSQLSRPGSASGPTRIGGYLGFASSLDTALRGKLGSTVVMLVRAQRPSYWVGETFSTWNGVSWTAPTTGARPLRQRSPIVLPVPVGSTLLGQSDLQTFYVTTSTADLVFHAETADELWFPGSTVYDSDDGTIVSPIGMGRGAIYTVASEVSSPSAAELRSAAGGAPLPPATETADLQLPHAYPRVRALAQAITAHDTTNYGRVEALITWIGAHTRYSTDIPPLPRGADTVDEFLFGNRVGFCEQISTSLTVMLRSLGIPACEAVGYVPGPYDPVTDLYEIRADDAHAWVQVWFPGFGWQNFDPTAVVPLSNPAPGATALHDLASALGRLPLVPLAAVLGGGVLLVLGWRWRRARPTTWVDHVAQSAERAGRRAGHARQASETFPEYAAMLDDLTGNGSTTWRGLAALVEASAYGGMEPSPEDQRHLVTVARRWRVGAAKGPTFPRGRSVPVR